MTAYNEHTGDLMKSKANTTAYADGYDKIFGKKDRIEARVATGPVGVAGETGPIGIAGWSPLTGAWGITNGMLTYNGSPVSGNAAEYVLHLINGDVNRLKNY